MKTIKIKSRYRELIVKYYADGGMRITHDDGREINNFWLFSEEVKELKKLFKGDKDNK